MKKMSPISCDEARDKHGITCPHSRAENGELRFRLLKNDGTAYIRTEAPPEGGWQDSHWHNKVMETYIVQSGWIGYAEMRDGEPELIIYRAGESFTTPPNVIHNVYLPAEAVIHTVKHGEAREEARLEDSRTAAFTAKVCDISESNLLIRARTPARRVASADGADQYAGGYSPAYMHFDDLIWQVPAWATAIFTIILAGMTRLEDDSPLLRFVGLSAETLLALAALMFGLLLLVLSHALYRFRWHQIGTKSYTPQTPLLSPQIGLQIIVNAQAVVLILLASQGLGFSIAYVVGVVVLLFGQITFWQEKSLVRKGKEGNRPLSTAS